MINLQTQLLGNNIFHRTQKITQKHLPHFKLSKTVGLGFDKTNTSGKVLIPEKNEEI